MTKFLTGKKTYISLAVALIGVFGLAQYVSPEEITEALNSAFILAGIIGAIYGRIDKEIRSRRELE